MIDYNELEKALSRMKPRQRLYEIVKAEMIKRGRWKKANRGKDIQQILKDKG